jgi:hypothetical protein
MKTKNTLFMFLVTVVVMCLFGVTATKAQTTCTPTFTVAGDPGFPGSLAEFIVTSGPNSLSVDANNAGTGLQTLTVVSSINATVTIPAFTPGTTGVVTPTLTRPDPNSGAQVVLRAASTFHAVFITLRCGGCTPVITVTNDQPASLAEFIVTGGVDSVAIDANNAGTGLRTLTVVSAVNATVTIPAFTPGTTGVVTPTFSVTNITQAATIRLRAASLFHSVFIDLVCAAPPSSNAPENPQDQ